MASDINGTVVAIQGNPGNNAPANSGAGGSGAGCGTSGNYDGGNGGSGQLIVAWIGIA